jgi:transcriptional regulator GlxA family with amidase domain
VSERLVAVSAGATRRTEALRGRSSRALATELLAQPGLAVADVAERLGYADATNFARLSPLVRVSPRRYRSRGARRSGE